MNLITNDIGYSGKVQLKIKKYDDIIDTVVINNAGTINLCNFLKHALMGDVTLAKRPGMIIPCKKDEEGLHPLFTYGISYSSVTDGGVEVDSSNYEYSIMKLKFLLPSTLFSAQTHIWGFKLYGLNYNASNASETEMASIQLPEELVTTSGVNLELEWALKITYGKKENA